ncbi:hypothetical protein [Bdellovibrio svalbardensis]|uniref:Bdellovibrio beta-sandwich domain-containing protein n=1 Tax=Bdellovibrio svalbardensis TaxID=2972972 RepID=A0ABT6DPB9_9BACT|nr:hypothetical protein [Bdellovibrio svalbardensis]MDG0817681.1 hypothetical protein [Bdellovibrio svalbardensis]
MISRLSMLLIVVLPGLAFAKIDRVDSGFVATSAKSSPLEYGEERNGKITVDLTKGGFSCEVNGLILKAPELRNISEDNIDNVHFYLENAEECQRNLNVITELIRNKSSVELAYNVRKRAVTYHLDYSEFCNETTCGIDVMDREVIEVSSQFLGYNLQGSSSRTVSYRTVTWPRGACPPWSPDCDL